MALQVLTHGIIKMYEQSPISWHHKPMPKRSSKDRDFAMKARSVVEQAIGEHLDGSPLNEQDTTKNPHAVALGRLGGIKGGKARAEKLTKAQRHRIALKAAKARWHDHDKDGHGEH